jgi:hypothetical protein
VSGEDVTGGSANGGAAGDEAVWQDLVARYEMPDDIGPAAPWPDRENLTAPPRATADDGPAGQGRPAPPPPSPGPGAPKPADHAQGTAADRTRVVRPAAPPSVPGSPPWPPAAADGSAGRPGAAGPGEADEADEHFVPPPPPPLPHLDSVAKGAWTALFGGPCYLLVATFAGWTVPGWAALLAIAAFVIGFVVLVLRLGDGPSRGTGPDNGAVL